MTMSAFFLKSKYLDKISISVGDLQNSSLPLIYQTEFSDYNLRIGDNILSQHWRQRKLQTKYFSDKNAFRFVNVYILI